MRKTVFLSEATPSWQPDKAWQIQYIFYDRSKRKWYEDTMHFNDLEKFTQWAKSAGYLIK